MRAATPYQGIAHAKEEHCKIRRERYGFCVYDHFVLGSVLVFKILTESELHQHRQYRPARPAERVAGTATLREPGRISCWGC